MVDRIKFIVDNAEIDPEILKKRFYEGYKDKKTGHTAYTYKNNVVDEDSDKESKNDSDVDNKYSKYLFVKYIKYKNPIRLPNVDYDIKNMLIIHRNVRRDYSLGKIGVSTLTDLSYVKFEKMINKYAKEFAVEENKFWKARVTKLELGVTLRLKSSMKGILSCFDSFDGLNDKHIYGNDGISFIGENFSVSFYDKIEKMYKNNELFTKIKSKKKLKSQMTKDVYYLRFELKIEKVSGFYKGNFHEKINHLKSIRDNWNHLCQSLVQLYSDVKYIDVLSPEIEDTISGEERTPMNNFLKFKGIQSVGKDVFFNQLLPMMKQSQMSKFRSEYRKFYNDYERKFRYGYQEEFKSFLEERIEKLKLR